MFKMVDHYKQDFELYQKKFFCPNQEDLRIFGDYNTEKGQLFNVQFIKCHDRPDCKKPEEITRILRDKYILIVYN